MLCMHHHKHCLVPPQAARHSGTNLQGLVHAKARVQEAETCWAWNKNAAAQAPAWHCVGVQCAGSHATDIVQAQNHDKSWQCQLGMASSSSWVHAACIALKAVSLTSCQRVITSPCPASRPCTWRVPKNGVGHALVQPKQPKECSDACMKSKNQL